MRVIHVSGPRGCGKTTIAMALQERLLKEGLRTMVVSERTRLLPGIAYPDCIIFDDIAPDPHVIEEATHVQEIFCARTK